MSMSMSCFFLWGKGEETLGIHKPTGSLISRSLACCSSTCANEGVAQRIGRSKRRGILILGKLA